MRNTAHLSHSIYCNKLLTKHRCTMIHLTRWCFFIGILFLAAQSVKAQATTVFTEANAAYKEGKQLYDQSVFSLAQKKFLETQQMLRPLNDEPSRALLQDAELHYAKAAVRLGQPEGEKLILDFARKYAPDPVADNAVVEMAEFYFNSKDYEKAIALYNQLDTRTMDRSMRNRVLFNQGYAYFVRKKFPQAKASFEQLRNNANDEYYYPANYYYGLCLFYENKYDKAAETFKKVEPSPRFKPYIPFYITQIYFAQGDYDKVIAYARPKCNDASLRNLEDINKLVGQAFFEKGDYQNALPHLEYYANRKGKMTEEEFYQLGITQRETGNCEVAVKNLEPLGQTSSLMGQHAMFMLGDCYIKIKDKNSARAAFGKAARMPFDKELQEEALFNYAKLSYELNADREAIEALQQIREGSKYYNEAQVLMSDIFLNTKDYAKALDILDKIPNKTPRMRDTWQKVLYLRGLQLYRDNFTDQAKGYFKKAIDAGGDARTKALATYWYADVLHKEKDFAGSQKEMGKFLVLGKSIGKLPDESSMHTANYVQGYNLIKQDNYTQAISYFRESADGIKANLRTIQNPYVREQVLGDAVLRTGDCYLKKNQYDEALKYYNEAVSKQYSNFVYALYQKAIIEGLRNNQVAKINALEDLVRQYPKSSFADNALLQLGITYQEAGRLGEATKPLIRLINDFKGNSDLIVQALLRLGLINYNQGNTQEAIRYYKDVFKNNPEEKERQAALTSLEEIYVDNLGRPDEFNEFKKSVGYEVKESEKEDRDFKAAEAQYAAGQYDRAITGYSDYLAKYPNGRYALNAYYQRAESYAVQKKYEKALPDYESVAAKGQSKYYEKALFKAAVIAYNHSQNFNKAYELYAKLEQTTQDQAMKFEGQLGMMRSAYRSGRMNDVRVAADKVRNNPNAAPDQKGVANFYLGKLFLEDKKYDQAMEAFQQTQKLIPGTENAAEAYYDMGYILYLKRSLDKAEEWCINSNAEISGYSYWVARCVLLLADIYTEKNDYFNAQAALEALLENYKEDEEIVRTAQKKLDQIKARQGSQSRLLNNLNNDELEMEPEPSTPKSNNGRKN